MLFRIIPIAVLTCCTPALATPLTPADRALFAKGTSESCFSNQVKVTANRKLTVGQLQNFCDCYGKAFSEYVSVEDLPKIKESLTPEATKMAGVFMQKCTALKSKK
jgi:hypothetical protein